MRKALLGIVTAAIVLSLGATSAFAAGPSSGRYFIDADGDGVCDNAVSRCVYVDADGDGVCDHYGSNQGRGCGYGHGAQCGRGNGFRGGRGR